MENDENETVNENNEKALHDMMKQQQAWLKQWLVSWWWRETWFGSAVLSGETKQEKSICSRQKMKINGKTGGSRRQSRRLTKQLNNGSPWENYSFPPSLLLSSPRHENNETKHPSLSSLAAPSSLPVSSLYKSLLPIHSPTQLCILSTMLAVHFTHLVAHTRLPSCICIPACLPVCICAVPT